jgi:hypothetical protein
MSSELEETDGDTMIDRDDAIRTQYRRGRSFRSSRRRSSKAAGSHPGFGIAGRRNRRWSW